jgi:hypothetical protein
LQNFGGIVAVVLLPMPGRAAYTANCVADIVVAGIVLNAIGTGALSGPYDRYSVTARAERDPGVARSFLVLRAMLQRRHRLFGAIGSACTIVR